MAIDLKSLETGKINKPPRIIIYGTNKIGKTTFACAAPKPVLIQTEEGSDEFDVARWPLAIEWNDVMEGLKWLYTNDHPFKTVVLDSLDWCEKLVHIQVAKDQGKPSITDIGYAKGYDYALGYFDQLLKGLTALRNKKGMAVILIAHSQIKRFESPESEAYDRYQLDLHHKAASMFVEWADCILFANYKTHIRKLDEAKALGVGKGERFLYTEERPAFIAGNRWKLPFELPLEWSTFEKALCERKTV
jgi:hypothetical protein